MAALSRPYQIVKKNYPKMNHVININMKNLTTREQTINTIRQAPNVDVLIIGGGVNGIGVFRDLAINGVRVLLVEKADFCSGASAAASHMAHGGIRYLENGEFRLVREAVIERNRLLINAPHYVKPLPTTIPMFKALSGLFNAPLKFVRLLDKPSERGALIIKMGLIMYDAYTGSDRTVPRHDFKSRKSSLAAYPLINPDIIATATYFDGAILQPERLCIEMILDAEAANPNAHAVNYLAAGNGSTDTVNLIDQVNGETVAIRPKVVINAAGPWIDFTNDALGKSSRFIGGTKGSHLVLNHPELRRAIGENEFFFENEDGRIVLIYPWFDRVLIGTSDLKIDHPDDVRCTEEEVDYFIEMTAKIFPSIQVEREHIVFRFSGVRPLPAQDAATTGQISRDHSIRVIEANEKRPFSILSLVGGKWTSFRAFAEQVTDDTLTRLKIERTRSTHDLPIGGGDGYPSTAKAQREWVENIAAEYDLPQERVQTLFNRYGSRAKAIAAFCAASNDSTLGEERPLTHRTDYSTAEIRFLIQMEGIVYLDDLILRRTLIGMLGYLTLPLLQELCSILATANGWDDARRQAEEKRTIALLAENHQLIF